MSQKIQNVVQPLKWFEALPRKSYEKYEKLTHSHPWFEVYRLPGNVLGIYEPGHFQEVVSFLIFGEERALLLDTGMGIGDMGALVKELTDLPLIVVNSHTHFDHIGCNWQFSEIFVYNFAGAVERLKSGMAVDDLVQELAGDSTCIPYPDGFDPDKYTIKPSNPNPIEDGHRFNLGGRELEVIHTPGHSPDSIMLLDKSNSILFTGDTYYPATLYAHLTSREKINSQFEVYRQTMMKLAGEIEIEWLYASHNEPVQPGSTLKDVAEAFDAISKKDVPYEVDEEGLKKYSFNGFAIVTSNEN